MVKSWIFNFKERQLWLEVAFWWASGYQKRKKKETVGIQKQERRLLCGIKESVGDVEPKRLKSEEANSSAAAAASTRPRLPSCSFVSRLSMNSQAFRGVDVGENRIHASSRWGHRNKVNKVTLAVATLVRLTSVAVWKGRWWKAGALRNKQEAQFHEPSWGSFTPNSLF